MGFAVFADQPGGIAPEIHGRAEEILELLPTASASVCKLALDKALQKPTAGLVVGASMTVQPLEQLVGNGNHHLGHSRSIYGIAGCG